MKFRFVFFALTTFFSTLLAHSHYESSNAPYQELESVFPFLDHGWFSDGNKKALEKLIVDNDVHTIIELGSWLGKSTIFFAENIPEDGKVYAVDHWKGNEEHSRFPKLLPSLYEQFLSNMIHKGVESKVVPLRMTTLEASEVINFLPDLIYVDASHDTDSVVEDLEAWFPLVKGHGIICGDDWGWGKTTFGPNGYQIGPVGKAVVYFCEKNNLSFETNGWFWRIIE